MEKFEIKIIDMRDMYEDRKSQGIPLMVDDSDESESDEGPPQRGDPFYESGENHNLIGVANVFLDCLFYDVKLDYHVPIISQQGEVAGKLHVEISKLGGAIMDRYADIHLDDSDDESSSPGTPLIIRVKIHEAKGLPKDLSNFVFCQYTFWGHDDPISVPPDMNPDSNSERRDTKAVRFAHERDFKVFMSEEFVECAQEGALSIEVYGHKVVGFGAQNSLVDLSRSNSLMDRWHEVTRKIEFWAEIHEVNDQGEYSPVEVKSQNEVPSAGVFQLRQGHARRIMARIKTQVDSGTLPLICDSISSVSIGCICARSKLQKGLDSYQEEDLNLLRDRWSDALSRRHKYLDSQIQKLINKQDKTESDCDRERALIEQWVALTEERNAVLVPAAGSGIPGAPADWEAPPEMEQHRPVLFLDLNSDDMTTPSTKEGIQAVGINSILPKEQTANYMVLPILKNYTEKESVCAVASWDSSIHDSPHLNKITNANDRIYLILKVVVRLSHPAYMELVLRKRLCVNVKHRNISFTDRLKKRIIGTDGLLASCVTYDVVSNIPKASEGLEGMETLAQMAASQNEVSTADGETYIEKYIKGVSAVESILILDRLRQEVAVKELMAAQGRSLRKTTSVPNINQYMTTPPRLDERVRFDSIQDLAHHDLAIKSSVTSTPARPSFLDLKVPSLNVTPKSGISPMGAKIGVKPLQTLQEEQHQKEHQPLLDSDEDDDSPMRSGPTKFKSEQTLHMNEQPITRSASKQELLETKQDLMSLKQDLHKLKKSLIDPDPSSVDSDDFQDFESYESQQVTKQSDTVMQPENGKVTSSISHSGTSDSITEGQFKSNTPSMISSGYGSQAVSTLTLSSEDSLSLRSNEDAESNRFPKKSGFEHSSSGESDGDENGQNLVSAIPGIQEESLGDLKNVGIEMSANSPYENEDTINEEGKVVVDVFDRVSVKSETDDEDNLGDKQMALHISEEDLRSGENEQTKSTLEENDVSGDAQSNPKPTEYEVKSASSVDQSLEIEKNDSVENMSKKIGLDKSEGSRDSDSSSNVSRGPLHSDSIDPYSLEAMEELERLGDEFGPDNSEFLSMDESLNSSSKQVTPNIAKNLNTSLSKCDIEPSDQSTPKRRDRKGSSGRERPVSCIVTSKNDMDLSMEDKSKRNSLDTSDEHLSEDSMSVCSFGSRADLDRLSEIPIPSWIQVGESVMVSSSKSMSKMTGVVQFVGNVEFATGPWVGVELDLPEGKNDGSVNGIRYFRCRSRHGLFVRHDKLIWDKKRKGSRKSAANLMNRRSFQSGTSPISKGNNSLKKK